MNPVLVCFGTRPEVIKMAPVVWELQRREVPFKILFSGQHRDLYRDVAHLVPEADTDLAVMREGQNLNGVLSAIVAGADQVLRDLEPSMVLVQGDTSTVLGVALAAFHLRIPVGHVEAGLRTFDLTSPFPEEANRQMVSRIARWNWAPTHLAARNLKEEGIAEESILVTGNTVVDACMSRVGEIRYGHQVLVTLHRRENFGERMESLFRQIDRLAAAHPELEFIFPMHPNPGVQALRGLLSHVRTTAPMGYDEMVDLLSKVRFAITDSGGIQEEAAAFRKKVLVCRNTTERPEGIDVGLARLVDTDVEGHFSWANESPEWSGENPYGDGKASARIVDSILAWDGR